MPREGFGDQEACFRRRRSPGQGQPLPSHRLTRQVPCPGKPCRCVRKVLNKRVCFGPGVSGRGCCWRERKGEGAGAVHLPMTGSSFPHAQQQSHTQ